MRYSEKCSNALKSVFAACLAVALAGTALGQTRGPREYFDEPPADDGQFDRLDRATRDYVRNRRALRITGLSRARARGEKEDVVYDRNADPDVSPRNYGAPIRRGYAEMHDSRYHRDAAESPAADDQRPLRSPRSGHYDPRIGEYADFGPYAEFPIGRSSRGGEDRPDAPGYVAHAGRDSSLANGYRVRGVQEFSDARGQGVRLDDVYPLDPSVDPRRYRGHFDSETYGRGYTDEDDNRDLEAFIRREMMVRPGANLRVSSTGTYDFYHYIQHGNIVNARFRQPAHRRWQYANP